MKYIKTIVTESPIVRIFRVIPHTESYLNALDLWHYSAELASCENMPLVLNCLNLPDIITTTNLSGIISERDCLSI